MIGFITNNIVDILQLAFIIIFGLYLKNYLPAYFGEKAKNLATKEDIGNITRIVESVKTEFTHETERLKVDLQFLNQNKISLSVDKRNAILDFYKNYCNWLQLMLDSSELSLRTPEDVFKLRLNIEQCYFKVQTSRTLFDLYIDDEVLGDKSSKLIIDTLHFHNEKVKFLLNIEYQYDMKNIANSLPQENRHKNHQETLRLINEFNKEKLDRYKVIATKLTEFQNAIKSELYSTENDKAIAPFKTKEVSMLETTDEYLDLQEMNKIRAEIESAQSDFDNKNGEKIIINGPTRLTPPSPKT